MFVFGGRLGYKTPRYRVCPNGQAEGEKDHDNDDNRNDRFPPISPIWLTSSAAATLSSPSEEKRKLLRQPRDAPGVYLRNQTLCREEWGRNRVFYTDITKMKERHPNLSCPGCNGLDFLDPPCLRSFGRGRYHRYSLLFRYPPTIIP